MPIVQMIEHTRKLKLHVYRGNVKHPKPGEAALSRVQDVPESQANIMPKIEFCAPRSKK